MMESEKESKKDRFFCAFVCTFLFGIITHGYRFFNLDFSHASLSIYKNTGMQMIAIGRFLQPVYLFFRGRK